MENAGSKLLRAVEDVVAWLFEALATFLQLFKDLLHSAWWLNASDIPPVLSEVLIITFILSIYLFTFTAGKSLAV